MQHGTVSVRVTMQDGTVSVMVSIAFRDIF